MSNKDKRSRLIEFCSQAISEMPFQDEDGKEFPIKGYYVCPLCKKTFNLQELGDKVGDVLTLEDVAPFLLPARNATVSVDTILITGCCMSWNCNMEIRTDN